MFLTSHSLKYPGQHFRIIDEDNLNEVAGILPIESSGVSIENLLERILQSTALFSDEELRNAVLVSRMVRANSVIHWVLRFIYEARGLTFHENDP